MNVVELIGRLTRDPEVRYGSKTLTAVARFTLAVNGIKTSDGKEHVDYISVVCFGKTAEHVEKYLVKGRQCSIVGHIQTGYYLKDDTKVYTTDVVAEKVEFLGKRPDTTEAEKESSENIPEGFQELSDDDIPF